MNKQTLLRLVIVWFASLNLSVAEESPRLQPFLNALNEKNIQSASAALEKLDSPLNTQERRILVRTIESLSLRGEWIPLLEKLAEKNPAEIEFTYQTARTFWRAGDEESALSWCRKVIAKDPTNESLLYRVAAIAYAINQFDPAEKWISKILKINPAHLDAQFLQGCVHARQGKNESAEAFFLKVVKTNPHYHKAYFEL